MSNKKLSVNDLDGPLTSPNALPKQKQNDTPPSEDNPLNFGGVKLVKPIANSLLNKIKESL